MEFSGVSVRFNSPRLRQPDLAIGFPVCNLERRSGSKSGLPIRSPQATGSFLQRKNILRSLYSCAQIALE